MNQPTPQIAAAVVHSPIDVEQQRHLIARKPVANAPNDESRVSLLTPSLQAPSQDPSCVTDLGESSKLVREDTRSKQRLGRTRWLHRDIWSELVLLPTTVHWVAICLFIVGLILACTWGVLRIIHVATSADTLTVPTCDSSANFAIGNAESFWSPSTAFEITVGFGHFGFSTAKMIDVLWDMVTFT